MVYEGLSPALTSATIDTNVARNPLLAIPPTLGLILRKDTAMKKWILILSFVMYNSLSFSQTISDLYSTELGGPDIHGDLYQKRYAKPTDFRVNYEKWNGYIIKSNKELELLYSLKPDCEAIKFDFWQQEGKGNDYIDLSSQIGLFKNLKYLEISSNRIKSYPKNIENLVNLNEIVLQLRNKEEIEFNFNHFKELKHLTIHHADNLKEFPLSIFECENLVSLKLFRCHRVSNNILSGINNLNKLQELFIWDSRLLLPNDFNPSLNLKTLILERYRSELPESIYDIKSIERLALCTFFDTIDLKKISKLQNLKTLELWYQDGFKNELSLSKLEHLAIITFKGDNLSIGIDELPSLESLKIWDCSNIESLDNISNPQLKSIIIRSNPNLIDLNLESERLIKLEEVIIKSNPKCIMKNDKINGITIQN